MLELYQGDSFKKSYSFGEGGRAGKGKTMCVTIYDDEGEGVEIEDIKETDGIFVLQIGKKDMKNLPKGEYTMRIKLEDGDNSRTVQEKKIKIK